MDKEAYKRFVKFIIERHAIYTRRQAGQSWPWTQDEILQKYSFCNVYRELDKTTIWIAENWRQKAPAEHVWMAMLVARVINWPDTLKAIAVENATPFNRRAFLEAIRRRSEKGLKVWGGAYMVTTSSAAVPKPEYFADIFQKVWDDRRLFDFPPKTPLDDLYRRLLSYHGLGSFLCAQVIADIKYVGHWRGAPDWCSFVAPGPGSKRGLARIYGMQHDRLMTEDRWRLLFLDLFAKFEADWERKQLDYKFNMPELPHAQDLQNCLCEFDKYERTRLGEGRPRSLYRAAVS